MKKKQWILYGLFLISSGLAYPGENSREQKASAEFKSSLNIQAEHVLDCSIAAFFPGKKPIVHSYKLYVKGNNTLLITLKPERDKGKMILLIKDQFWQYFPRIDKAMNINSAVAVNGNVNITDIVSSAMLNLYHQTGYKYMAADNTDVFWFTANGKEAPYGKIKYDFRDGKIRNLEIYARSGILLKKVYFVEYRKDADGKLHPSKIKIVNSLKSDTYSLVSLSNYTRKKIPDYYFNPSSLGRIHY